MTILRFVFGLIALQIGILKVYSCECPKSTYNQEKYNDLGAIFIGELIEVNYDLVRSRSVLKFEVYELFKGELTDGYIFAYGYNDKMCSLYSEKGKKCLYAISSYFNELIANKCSIIKEVDKVDKYMIPEELGRFLNAPDTFKVGFHKNGRKSSEGMIRQHLPYGPWVYYDSFERITHKGCYLNGKYDGLWTFTQYSKIGISRVQFKNGLLDGENLILGNDTFVISKTTYSKGMKSGPFYYRNYMGRIESEGKWRNDTLIEITKYSSDGKLMFRKNEDIEKEWYPNGIIKYEKKLLKNGIVHVKSYRMNGDLEMERIENLLMVDNVKRLKMIYASTLNGNAMVRNGEGYYCQYGQEGFYKDSVRTGKWIDTFNNGTIEIKHYEKGVLHGQYLIKDIENDLIVFTGTYENGRMDGAFKSLYNNGMLEMEGFYEEGVAVILNLWDPQGQQLIVEGNGIYKKYDRNGSLLSQTVIEYENGRPKE